MGIVLGVALVARARSVTQLLSAPVTVSALDPAVGTRQSEVGGVVVERIAIESHDVGPATRVLRMAVTAFRALGRRSSPVKALPAFDVGAHIVVTLETQPTLGLLAKRLVALAAILLDVGMCGDHRPRHDERLERDRACRFRQQEN
jgi:hypothetical protein